MPSYDKPVNGDASETAIVKFYQPFEDILDVRARHPIGKQADAKAIVPFNSAHKFSLKVVAKPMDGSYWTVYLKGASERVWDKCSHVLVETEDIEFDQAQKDKVMAA